MGLLDMLGGAPAAPASTAPVNQNKAEYKTEFHQLAKEFVDDIAVLRDKYPLAVLVSVVALGIFGLLNVLSFSVTNILTGTFLLLLSWNLGTSIYRRGISFFTSDIRQSIGRVLSYQTPAAEEKKPESSSTLF